MKTIRLRLVPDQNFPMFQRLTWEFTEVPLWDVLESGVHPWIDGHQPHDMAEAFYDRLSASGVMPPALEAQKLTYPLYHATYNQWTTKSRFEQALEHIREELFFCEPGLDWRRLLEIAREKLRKDWNSSLALRLADHLNTGFPALRAFLKAKDPQVKLQGYQDLGQYNWAEILSLDDFQNHERLVIEEAIRPLNFRSNAFLEGVTDRQGRLRLVSSIDCLTLQQRPGPEFSTSVQWQAQRKGNHWRLRPNIGGSLTTREAAMAFAQRWRRDDERLCFRATTKDVVAIAESGEAIPSFPGLRYNGAPYSAGVAAHVPKDKLDVYVLGGYPRAGLSGERLKALLREYGVSTTGVKRELVQKIAKLAADEYEKQEAELDTFFHENRFVRVARDVKGGHAMPVLSEESPLKGLLLTLYALRHLRGSAVIDPRHVNAACPLETRALALLTGRITLTGGFLRIL